MKNYQVVFSSKAKKDLKKIDRKLQLKIFNKITGLPTKNFSASIKKLINFSGASYRLRVGDYRILFDIYDDNQEIVITKIGHRKEIYR